MIQSYWTNRSSHSEVFLGKGVLKICSKFTGEHPCLSVVISIKLQSNFVEITLRHFSHSHFHTNHTFLKNTPGWLLLHYSISIVNIIKSVHEKTIFFNHASHLNVVNKKIHCHHDIQM